MHKSYTPQPKRQPTVVTRNDGRDNYNINQRKHSNYYNDGSMRSSINNINESGVVTRNDEEQVREAKLMKVREYGVLDL